MEPRILFSADTALVTALATAAPPAVAQAQAPVDGDRDGGPSVGASARAVAEVLQPREIVIIDAGVPDLDALLADIGRDGTDSPQMVVLDERGAQAALTRLGEILQDTGAPLSAVHLISHGADGELSLGGEPVTTLDLLARAGDIAAWRTALADGVDFLLYGCNVAASSDGRNFVDTLARLTGADVAASDDATGAASSGGDWRFEYARGEVSSEVVVGAALQERFEATLAIHTVTDLGDGGIDTLRRAISDGGASPVWTNTIRANGGAGIAMIDARDEIARTREVVFVDTDATDYRQLVDDLLQQRADGREFDIFVLDDTRDGIEQIGSVLAGYEHLEAVHIISHGVDGAINIGATDLDADALRENSSAIAAWGDAFDETGDLLIYGCDLAASIEGQDFVDALARLTGTDVAASIDVTGHAVLGGDWDLEYAVGYIRADLALSDDAQAVWMGTLDTTSGLVGHYQFDEAGGATATDASGNADGTLVNAPTRITDGPVGDGALDFSGDANGSNAYVRVADNAAQDTGAGSWTMAFWYNLAGNPSGDVHLVGDHDGQAGSSGFRFYADSSGDITLERETGLMSERTSVSGTFNGTWQHVMLTYDTVTDGTQWCKNANPRSESGHGSSTSSSSGMNTSNPLQFGAVDSANLDYESKLDEVRLYMRARDASDVAEVYASRGRPDGYPDSYGDDNSVEWITNVTYAGIDNTTGRAPGGYENYTTTHVATVTAGDTNTLSIGANKDDNLSAADHVKAWIDWNQDGDFDDADEEVYSHQFDADGSFDVDVDTPGDAVAGTTVMRVSMDWNQDPASSGMLDFGEVEDYAVTVVDANSAPTFTSTAVTAATEDAAYSYTITTDDVDVGDSLVITASTLPTWLTLTDDGNGTASLSGTPTNAEVGSHNVVLDVNDGTTTVTQSFTIVVANTNDAPTFTSTAVTGATEDAAYSYNITTGDVDVGDTRTITASTLPVWLTLVDNTDGTASLTGTPTNIEVGNHSVVLEVDDGEAPAVTQSFTVTVTNINDAPTFTSTAVTAAIEDTAYSYAITTDDVDAGDSLAITASTLPTWLTLTDNSDGTASLTGTPTNAEVGSHSVVLEVDDGEAPAVTQSFTIVVANTNDAPTFTSTAVTVATENTAYSYAITTDDVDAGDSLAITASTLPAWLTLTDNSDGTASLTGMPTNAEVGNHSVVLDVNDGTTTVAQSFTIVVSNTNDAPTFTSTAVTAGTEDAAYSYAITTDDVDVGDSLAITASTLPAWLTLTDNSNGTASLTGTPTNAEVGDHSVVLEVDDGEAAAVIRSFTVTVANVNDAPTFTSTAVTAATEDAVYSYNITTGDVDVGDTRTITASTLPAWLTLVDNTDGTASLTGTPTNAEVGDHSVVLEMDDGEAPAVTQSFTVTVTNTNDAPTFTSTAVTGATEDAGYSYNITTGDVDVGDTRTITASTLPAWLTLVDNTDGTASLTGTPTNAEVGDHSVVLEVDDGEAAAVTQSFTVTVTNTNDAPTFTSTAVTAAIEDAVYSYNITTGDVDVGDTRTITASTLPAWLTLTDNSNGTASLTGTPTNAEVGSHSVVLDVNDGTTTVAQSFTIVVSNTNDAPTFTSTAVTAATEDAAYSYAITTDDVDAGDSLAITASTLPTWLTLTDNSNGTASLTGTPTNAEVGDHSVVLEVDDGEAPAVTQGFTVTVVNTNDAPTFTSTAVTAATEDAAYSYAITTDDVDAGDSLAITASTLPTWLTLTDNTDGTASLTGTPTNVEVGSHSVVLEVNDGTTTVTQSFTIVVANTNDAPTFTSTAVTAATEDSAYSYAITTDDVDVGDSLVITASTLPTWLTLTDDGNGTASLSGTPTNAEVGSHSVVLEVDDGEAPAVTQSFTVTVTNTNDAPTFTSTAVTAATEDSAYSYAITTDDVDVGDSLAITASTLPTWLTLTDNNDGTASLTGTPTNTEVGNHSVVLDVNDGTTTVAQSFTIVVANTNDAPTLTSTAVTAATEDAAYSYAITTDDVDAGDSLAITASTLPTWLTLTDNTDGTASLTGTPTNAEVGSHSVVLDVNDGTAMVAQSFTITVTIANSPNDDLAPITIADRLTTREDTALLMDPARDLLANDTDPESRSISLQSIGQPEHGSLAVLANGLLEYRPMPDFNGIDRFDYVIVDEAGLTATGRVIVEVEGVNDPPALSNAAPAVPGSAQAIDATTPLDGTLWVAENESGIGRVWASDIEGGAVTFELAGRDAALFEIDRVTGELNAIERLDFEVPRDPDGDNRYELEVLIGDEQGMQTRLPLIVSAVDLNEAPVFGGGAFSWSIGQTDSPGRLEAWDGDANDALVFTLVPDADGASEGRITLSADGWLLGADLEPGVHEFVVRVTDAGGLFADGVLTIRVNATPLLGQAMPTIDLQTFEPVPPASMAPAAHSGAPAPEPGDEAVSANVAQPDPALPDTDAAIEVFVRPAPAPVSIDTAIDRREPVQAPSLERSPVTLATMEALSSVTLQQLQVSISGIDLQNFVVPMPEDLFFALQRMDVEVDRDEAAENARNVLINTGVTTIGTTITIGYLVWLLRSGALMAAAMLTSPLWRPFDPIPILAGGAHDEDDEDQHNEGDSDELHDAT